MSTPITLLLNIKTPVLCAPMAGASGGALAAQVSLAGGFGFIGAGYWDAGCFRKELELASSILQEERKPMTESSDQITRTDTRDGPLKIGVGYLGWKLDQSNESAELLSIALEARVAAVWLAFGTDLGKWVRHVRKFDASRSKPHTTIVFVLVNCLQDAQKAVKEWDADVLVAQGIECGGHGYGAASPLLALVPEILKSFPEKEGGKPCPPVVAAGGLTSGAHIAALLALGASGVVLGTRFLLTPEAKYSDAQKAALLAACGTSTIRTTAFDALRKTTGFPEGINGRALYNKTVEHFDSGWDKEEVRRQFDKGVQDGDPEYFLAWSGTGIGLVNEIKPAADVVKEIHKEMIDRLRAVSTLLSEEFGSEA
ncbi:2-nitropropane dioxygenase [Fomitiporia mediterranea MF3/22]|uniref:2-nitropropane dioxygenase n=1 Tax=Fomitiporia mediterranea (strain MF3/22) TaxID=694068 RepID=UPI000440872B|nr:2-nitropropane dioxygenase [Fomitiporia mediterranea MF3/22]EJD07540.1 2-nitropropane dioxygenase [Fomitiporia mediterranea MF3/22]